MSIGNYPIYIKNVTLSETDIQNHYDTGLIESTITINGVDDGRLKFYETSVTLPAYNAGEKADVTLYRSIKAGEWSTLVLPFNLTKANATAVFGSDVQFAQFSGFTVDYGEDEENVTPLGITINLTSYNIPTRGNLAGGTPILIKTSKDVDMIQLDDVTLTDDINEVNLKDEYQTPGKLTGSLVKTVIPADGLFISNNKFWYSTGQTNVKAFHCWFELGAVLEKETNFGTRVFFVLDDGETTDIRELRNHKTEFDFKHSDIVYNLNGQQVNGIFGFGKLPKGLYIVNNKKILVK